MRPLNRLEPALPNQAMKTYGIAATQPGHWRTVSCAQTDCAVSASGWRTSVDEATPLGLRQAAYIRHRAGRAFQELREGTLTVFVFPPGEECFTEHRIRGDRPALYLVRGGDWRGIIGQPTIYDRPDQWVDDFATHQDRINHQLGE